MSSLSVQNELKLTVLITVVSGKKSLRECLKALMPQVNFAEAEILVPYDKWSSEVGELAPEFPDVRFHLVEELGLAASADISAHQHRLYDRRRAVGLQIARGRIIAMTEDHAQPAEDWCKQILLVHNEQPYAVIGGAIENRLDSTLNWAWYYCDFGRYGLPFLNREVDYVSDVNVSYKREPLMKIQKVWQDVYHETTVHWALQESGEVLFLDGRLVVYQHRPPMGLAGTFLERVAWGRVFAETRVNAMSFFQRLVFAAGTPVLPLLLLVRLIKNMRRQGKSLGHIVKVSPLAYVLLSGWATGELIGYLAGEPRPKAGKELVEMPAN